MRLSSIILYGTQYYPEKVARRLRACNVASWLGAGTAAFFAVLRLLDGRPGVWKFGTLSVLMAIAYASLPLLHRFGPLVAPLALMGLAYAWISFVTSVIGTDGGTPFWIASAAALGILLVGPERILTTVGLGLVAVGLVFLVHLVLPRDGGLFPPRTLFVTFTANIVASSIFLYGLIFYVVRQMTRAEEIAEREHQRSESLLVNILPPSVAQRLKQRSDAAIADGYPEASILFADMAGSTASAGDTSPEEFVRFLNHVFTSLDALVERHGLEKIKTTGDSYMVVSGVPEPRGDHAAALADLALDMRDALADLRDPKGRAMRVRIGIASGPVVAGVVGTRKLFYDVWGDAVNTASRMESSGEAGKIQVASATEALLADRFELAERGVIDVRGKGPMLTWFLVSRKTSTVQVGS